MIFMMVDIQTGLRDGAGIHYYQLKLLEKAEATIITKFKQRGGGGGVVVEGVSIFLKIDITL